MATLNRVCERGMRYTFATSFHVDCCPMCDVRTPTWLIEYVVVCCESECPVQHLASAVIVMCFEVVGKRDVAERADFSL